ncbi:uncharacterized protein LOC116851874 [Odontomachus brunneus]|uniref:uncharacterized protein LOC116851874 n=1 Tax=Odontomachus brunneus TaxID=486640 RepID=UPI0013F24C56|nr:uncharacterized protein LOC116851874 [Odontomachus brunneus]
METLESSRVCRLCGQQSGISINIFDENENHVRKINAMLPIMVHEMDLLPKHMCHRCSYKLEEFHKFYIDILKTDATLKGQLSWMQKGRGREKIGVPMVHIENVNIKTEPLDYDVYELEPIVENIDYINSMANSVAFPASCIREGLTYAAFSRCRCCCDKDQSRRRTTAERLCRNYKGSVSRCAEIADDPRRRTALDGACVRLRSTRRKVFARATLQDRPRDHLSHLESAVEEARVCVTNTKTKDMPALNTRDHFHDSRYATNAGTALQVADFSRSTLVRNLRPRKNLVNYAMSKKQASSNAPGPSTGNKTNLVTSNVTPALDFELTRQIKVEQLELEGRTLRPRKYVVDYYGPKRKSVTSELVHREQEKESQLPHRTKRRKLEDVSRNSKLQSKDKNTPNDLEMMIKKEISDDLDNTILGETTSTMSTLPKIADLPAKMKALATDTGVNLRDNVNYLRTNRSQSSGKFQLVKRKPVVANGTENRLKKSNKIGRLSAANYSPKYLRSQDTYLRNGKTRKYDYVEWSMKRLRTKKLMHAVAKNAKKVPAMLKLAESIKHYCETCNVSFMNMELFRLHACYYD